MLHLFITIHKIKLLMHLLKTFWPPSGRLFIIFSPFDVIDPFIYSHELHACDLDMHQRARKYKKDFRDFDARRRIRGQSPRKRKAVEMDNFQDPQACQYSLLPLPKILNQWLQCFYRYQVINLLYGNSYLFDFVSRLTIFHKDMNRPWKM